MIDELRSGNDISVKTVDEARFLLNNMPEFSPPPLGRMNPLFSDPRGTYRSDLINKNDPLGYVHAPNSVLQNALHALFPHYNIYFPNGKKQQF